MDFIYSSKKRNIYFIFSGILFLIGLFSIIFIKMNLGLDFSGGTLAEIEFTKTVNKETVENTISNLDFIKQKVVQKTGNNSYLIRINQLESNQIDNFKSTLKDKIGDYTLNRLEIVGPTISKDITNKAFLAIILAIIGIILYVAYAFRSVPKPANSWRFGVCAILSLVHDVIITMGIYIILGKFFGFEIDSLFVVGMLTILGFSVHDTIVVFDRIRENLKIHHSNMNFAQIVNSSVAQTFARSLSTSLTLILVLLALLFLGGESIRSFVVLLLIGVSFGTYSSIFVASPLLIAWQNRIDKKQK